MQPFNSSTSTDILVSGSLLLLDKPKGWTSFDAVNKIKNLVRRKYDLKKFKVGHSGTLDPMATGLLVICTGTFTKKLEELIGKDKVYIAEITLGIETNTYDAEGTTSEVKDVPALSTEELLVILQSFTGELQQTPPAFSAIKKNGVPLYELARAGKEVTPEPRTVMVHEIKLLQYSENKITLSVHSGKGFYVRSLAHDIGARLGCGAHLSALQRTSVGPYQLTDAWTIADLEKKLKE
ncbi:MAG: tRNA pseudouridine(55) synthase TruB [Bacteroidota bacterium]|nr:tRNA pseudouridine(55) synthase TruB [Bacteroidota bacterium]